MLGRRQIREKIIQTLYAYQQNPINQGVLERNMIANLEKIQNLYVYQLNFLVSLKHLAENQIEIGKTKFIKTEADLKPNQKFIKNKVLDLLENNAERLEFTSRNKNLMWDIHDELLIKTYQKITAGKLFQDYMKSPESSFVEDQKFIGKLFLRHIAENDSFHDHFASLELSWADDFHIANSMVQKTIGYLREEEPFHTLLKVFKEDNALIKNEEYYRKIEEYRENREEYHEKMEEDDEKMNEYHENGDEYHEKIGEYRVKIEEDKENKNKYHRNRKEYDSDRDFARKLLVQTLNHWEDTEKKIEDRLDNWELDRIALMDKIILVTALTELDYFPLTPSMVVLNEYIEVAKTFATEKSQVFVNGLLDRYVKSKNRP